MNKSAVKPSDILSDNENFVELNGLEVRKGTIAAFLKNIDLIEADTTDQIQKNAALQVLKELAPAIIAAGLHKHATFKNQIVADIIQEALES